jgi:formylglycine-generating enzyme required for sulfatase activity
LTLLGARILTGFPLRKKLLALDLHNNQIRNGVSLLLQSAEDTPLAWLDLDGNPLEAGDAQELARWQEKRPSRFGGFSRITNSLGMHFVQIPAGTFLMGAPEEEEARRADEYPQHEVTLTHPFYLGIYPVTQGQYEAVTGNNPAYFNSQNGGGPLHPVENVSWTEAQAFCERLSALPAERAARRSYRLPTEAEWEHACRAGTTTPFHQGSPPHASLVNYDGNCVYAGVKKGPYLQRTSLVGSYPPNAFGLYDMHGNVWEWTADWYDGSYYEKSPRKDPHGPKRGRGRVIRGGCWNCIGSFCRAAHRHGDQPETRDNFNGFRVAMTLAD